MADQLWQKGLPLDERIHRFTVGSDPQTDMVLAPFDVIGTAAHVRMLERVGLLPQAEASSLLGELRQLKTQIGAGEFQIERHQEDCHTAIEQALTAGLGVAGKNVHLGRSRNDQVMLALRLYMREAMLGLEADCLEVAAALANLAAANENIPMPGYTHLRKAMPSSAAMWALAYAEGLLEELGAAQAVLGRLDSNPLGAGAGFGVPLPLDRQYVADLLGFSKVQRNPIDVQNSRGRHELALAAWVSEVGNVLERFFWDVALFSMEELGFVKLPDEFTTGSSIMPQKRNPDVIELGRAHCRQLRGIRAEIEEVACGLPGSYHRDLQLLKEPLIRAVNSLAELLEVVALLVPRLSFNSEACARAMTPEIYATHEAYQRCRTLSIPFRDAYAAVGREALAGQLQVSPEAAKVSAVDMSPAISALKTELADWSKLLDSEYSRVQARLEAVL